MGKNQSTRVYGKFGGEAKPGESKVLHHFIDKVDTHGCKTMLDVYE